MTQTENIASTLYGSGNVIGFYFLVNAIKEYRHYAFGSAARPSVNTCVT